MTITGACIVNMVGGLVPQFCRGTATWRTKIEAVQDPILGALETKSLTVVELSVLEHYYGDRIAFRSCAVFIISQIFEVPLGANFLLRHTFPQRKAVTLARGLRNSRCKDAHYTGEEPAE
jgi:hypothetical protein